jgi:hypothetical protein
MASKAQTIRRIILGGAIYDLAVVGLLAIPATAKTGIDILFWVDQQLGGTKPLPVFEDIHMVFVSLFGLWVSAWAIARVISSELKLVRADLVMRLAVMALLIWIAATTESYNILYLFIAVDVVWTVLNFWGSGMLKDIDSRR